ncbi:MAG: M13 family metallopeptidase, partial [Acidobacteriota bacterium]|nr:M13 family metallopeptidase [Acidobacteriota bacterium]
MVAKILRSALRSGPAAAAAVLLLCAAPALASDSPESPAERKESPGEIAKARLRTLDVEGIGASGEACTDFYQYADGAWLQKNPIPSDRPRWGTSDELRQRNQNDLRDILEKLAADTSSAPGSDERKLGDFYGACMDETAIEAKGVSPIQSELARIDAIHDAAGLREEIARLHSMGVPAVFGFGSEEDRKDSSRVIAAAVQSGLGLPDRDYYLKTDAKSVEMRKKYVAHVAKTLELGGASAKKAAADAKAIMEFETRLAKASQNNVDLRDPDKTHHPM